MNKNEFFKVLDAQIRKLPPEEREEIFEDYREHFRKTAPDIFVPCVGQVSIVDGSRWNIEIWRDELRALDEQNA